MPFGEVFIEERNNKWNTPYLFNTKELDEETGLYYYGARYYDSRVSVWLSTDPLQEKYPNVSTYAYTFQNPVKYIDPTGMEGEDPKEDPTVIKVNKLTENYNKMISRSRTLGQDVAADNLQHFLDGSGNNKELSNSWLRGFSKVEEAENRILGYVENKNFSNWLLNIEKNTIQSERDYWIGDIKEYSPTSELSYASGASKIKADVCVDFTRGESEVITVVGEVQMNWYDDYNWNAKQGFKIPGSGWINDADGQFLEDHGGAKSYKLESSWTYQFRGTYDAVSKKWITSGWTMNGNNYKVKDSKLNNSSAR